MTETKLTWYSIDAHQKLHPHPPVGLEEAIAVAHRYYANAGHSWHSVEEAVAATMFGFMRDEDTFIEICVNDFENISYRFEIPKNYTQPHQKNFWGHIRHALVGVYRSETTLTSAAALEEKIREFFTHEPAEIRDRLVASGQ
jgi:hypothetical protein